VNLRCYLLSLLRIHRPDCQICHVREEHGVEMRKRLEELNWSTLPREEADSKNVVRTAISLNAENPKKIA
jgi:hypothetical protein